MIYSQKRISDGSDTYSPWSDARLFHWFCPSRCNSRPDSEPHRKGWEAMMIECPFCFEEFDEDEATKGIVIDEPVVRCPKCGIFLMLRWLKERGEK